MPRGVVPVAAFWNLSADAHDEAGEQDIITPEYFVLARRPRPLGSKYRPFEQQPPFGSVLMHWRVVKAIGTGLPYTLGSCRSAS